MIKFTELSKALFIQYMAEDEDFATAAKNYIGCDLDYIKIITKFAKECIEMMEWEDWLPFDKRYSDVSYYVFATTDGKEFIADLDTAYCYWVSGLEEGVY